MPGDETPPRCFNCGRDQSLVLFESLVDRDGNHTSIEVCTSCTVLYNTFLRSQGIVGESATRFQASAVEKVYATTDEDRQAVGRRRDACAPILTFLLDELGLPRRRAACLEIGAGGGYLTAMASQFFTRAYACELDLSEVTKTIAVLGIGNVIGIADLAELKERVDLVIMWHSLEHIAEPLNFLRGVREIMQDDGVLYFQVPLYRKNYVFPSHLWFFNAFAVTRLRDALGFAAERVVFDTTNDFMSVVFHRREGSVHGID